MDIILRRTTFSSARFSSIFSVRSVYSTVDPQSNLASKTDSEITEQSKSKSETSNKSTPGIKIKPLSGFGKAFEKFSLLTSKPSLSEPDTKFATLLRNSKFMQLGDPQGKIVEGKIVQVVGEDLYIDFGGKFECVCPKPLKNGSEYVRGSKVRLRLQELELSTKFLGAIKEITLREADALLVGSLRTSFRKET